MLQYPPTASPSIPSQHKILLSKMLKEDKAGKRTNKTAQIKKVTS